MQNSLNALQDEAKNIEKRCRAGEIDIMEAYLGLTSVLVRLIELTKHKIDKQDHRLK